MESRKNITLKLLTIILLLIGSLSLVYSHGAEGDMSNLPVSSMGSDDGKEMNSMFFGMPGMFIFGLLLVLLIVFIVLLIKK